jgi:MoaA/NifB/PqqE/SkfB family radical SAM enzyme
MLTLFSTQVIHIEISSKCTLKCPRCPRTELVPDNLNQEFSLQEFTTAFTPTMLSTISKIIFCGDVGDPIYAKDFLKIIKYIKHTSTTTVSIVTNGSYKDVDWWVSLGNLLGQSDQVTFSVDGWDQESNQKYRINSDWNSIVSGMRTLRSVSDCHMNWSMIYFNFNEAHVDKIKQTALDLGFDTFDTVCSSKFDGRYSIDGVDSLKPKLVAPDMQYKKTRTTFKQTVLPIPAQTVDRHAWARCLNWQKELFINVDGMVHPCPWFNSGYQINHFVDKYRDQLNIKTRGLHQVLNDTLWQEFVDRLDHAPLEVCKIKCKNAQ